jgi:hypothetical protein
MLIGDGAIHDMLHTTTPIGIKESHTVGVVEVAVNNTNTDNSSDSTIANSSNSAALRTAPMTWQDALLVLQRPHRLLRLLRRLAQGPCIPRPRLLRLSRYVYTTAHITDYVLCTALIGRCKLLMSLHMNTARSFTSIFRHCYTWHD